MHSRLISARSHYSGNGSTSVALNYTLCVEHLTRELQLFEIFGLTRPGIEPGPPRHVADVLTSRLPRWSATLYRASLRVNSTHPKSYRASLRSNSQIGPPDGTRHLKKLCNFDVFEIEMAAISSVLKLRQNCNNIK